MTEYSEFNEPGFDYNKPDTDEYSPKYWRCHSFHDVSEEDLSKFEKALTAGSKKKAPDTWSESSIQWAKGLKYAQSLVHQTEDNPFLNAMLARDVAVAFMCRIAQGKNKKVRVHNYYGWADNDTVMATSVQGHIAVNGVKCGDATSDIGILLVEAIDGTREGVDSRFVPFSTIHKVDILDD